MNINEVIELFYHLDYNSMTRRRNVDLGSVWYTTKPNEECRVHFRSTEAFNVMRLHMSTDTTDYRVTYQKETDRLRFTAMTIAGREMTEIVIDNLQQYSTEESLFQASLIQDMGGITFESVQMIMHIWNTAMTNGKEFLFGKVLDDTGESDSALR